MTVTVVVFLFKNLNTAMTAVAIDAAVDFLRNFQTADDVKYLGVVAFC